MLDEEYIVACEKRRKSVEKALAIVLSATNGPDERFMSVLDSYIMGKDKLIIEDNMYSNADVNMQEMYKLIQELAEVEYNSRVNKNTTPAIEDRESSTDNSKQEKIDKFFSKF